MTKAEFKEWLRERNEALRSLDVAKFRAFYHKWQKRGVYSELMPKDDKVIEVMIRKSICMCSRSFTEEEIAEARKWLKDRGFIVPK